MEGDPNKQKLLTEAKQAIKSGEPLNVSLYMALNDSGYDLASMPLSVPELKNTIPCRDFTLDELLNIYLG